MSGFVVVSWVAFILSTNEMHISFMTTLIVVETCHIVVYLFDSSLKDGRWVIGIQIQLWSKPIELEIRIKWHDYCFEGNSICKGFFYGLLRFIWFVSVISILRRTNCILYLIRCNFRFKSAGILSVDNLEIVGNEV